MREFFAKLRAKTNFRNPVNTIKASKYRRICFAVPLVVLLLAIVLGVIYQVVPTIDKFANIGIDFQGGTLLQVSMIGDVPMLGDNQAANTKYITDIVENHKINVALTQTSGEDTIIVRYTNFVDSKNYGSNELVEEMANINNDIANEVRAKFADVYPTETVEVSTSITGATASKDLLRTAFLSVGIALILIFIYIIIRFDFFSGISAIVALFHDIIMMMAFTVIFRIEVNSPFVAAVITIVAYSINNTIMVFDRVRNAVATNKKSEVAFNPYDIADGAVTETFTRTIFTTITTAVTILALIIIGVASIRSFALPILFGLICGLFSSVFIAPSLWAMMTDAKIKNDKKNSNGAPDEKKSEKLNKVKEFFEKLKPNANGKKTKKKKKKKSSSTLA